MCQSQQERGPCILVERLVVVSKMNFVNIFTGKLLSAREVGAPQSSRDVVAYWHFRTCRDVRLESAIRSITDIGQQLSTALQAHRHALCLQGACVDGEIIEWLERRELRKRDRLAGSRQSVYKYLP